MDRIGVLGYKGMIGSSLVKLPGYFPMESDVTDAVELDTEITLRKPYVIVNCAAKTNVDWCEANPEKAGLVNSIGAMNVFGMADKHNTWVVHFTTDHVFSGKWFGSYVEMDIAGDRAARHMKPQNYYGFTKLVGEASAYGYDNVKLIRMSCVVSETRQSIAKHLNKIKKHQVTTPPAFLWRSFISLEHAVELISAYVDRIHEMPKLLNLTGSKTVSWYRLIKEYAKREGLEQYVKPRFFEHPDPLQAPRPYRTGLDTSLSKALGFPQYDYKDCVWTTNQSR